MDDLQQILDSLEDRELDYVFERSKVNSDSEALKNAGVSRSGFYQWPEERRAQLNDYAQQLKRRAKMRAQFVLEDAAEDAARKLVELVKNRNPNVALSAAKDVLDRTAGKPTQRQEHSGPDGGAIPVRMTADEMSDDELATIARRGRRSTSETA